ncbi:S-adenosyl-L-methionine-dependent methyltransferase [Zopfia rhizophila CBS 207.26]|uniref:S-adenosyl-L-methionine-dependent methyltransferase n=1 Tax=Zopfia rhizophila CBS 207.26 TaxID=1314779 RepID=A0A6A6E1J2_9PEZI|nr:S-adenosyl-L-methionine-dependent methyltransferase [Zopfia rhizophila CBS 207.26]
MSEHALGHFEQAADLYDKTTGGSTRDVAIRALDLLPAVAPDSIVLDNACGTGVVTSEVLRREPTARVHAVDFAANMQRRLRPDGRRGPHVADCTFTHSITNFALHLFGDASKGAEHIYRTLKPGGAAVVTTWEELGYIPPLQKAQLGVRPGSTPFRIPIPDVWFQAEHLEETMKDGGFEDVEVVPMEVYYAIDSLPALYESFRHFFTGLTEEQISQMEKLFMGNARADGVIFQQDGQELLGLRMKAHVAVCKK